MQVQLIGDGPKNVTVWIRGRFTADPSPIELFGLKDMSPPPVSVVLASVVWCLEEKAVATLWAGVGQDEEPLFIMESRNSIRPDHPLPMPKEWGGKFYLLPQDGERCKGKVYWVILDFDKVLR